MFKVKVISQNPILVGGHWWLPGHIHEIGEAQLELTLEAYPDSLQVINNQPVALREVVADASTELPIKKKAK